MLATEMRGTGQRVVLLHGFTQSGRAWGPIADRLSVGHEVLAIDMPGHGASNRVAADLWQGAEMITTAGGAGDYVGYSMGGRFALHVALLRPDLVKHLVVVSATGGIDDPAERRQRRADDDAVAARVERDGVEAFVAWWLQRPLFSTLSPDAAAVETRLQNTAAGLASSLRLAGTGAQEPLWDRLGDLDMPVLVVAGGLDRRYVDQGHRLVEAVGTSATLVVIPGAGHACHLEAPEEFLAAVVPFLDDGRCCCCCCCC